MSDSSTTKQELAASLKALLVQKRLCKISIGEICSQCGLNRKSFYYHFKDKYDLIIWIFETEFMSAFDRDILQSEWDFLLKLCEYFEANRLYYRRVLETDGQNSLEEYLRALVRPMLVHLFPNLSPDCIRFSFYVNYYSDAFLAALRRWLNDATQVSAQDFSDLLQNCMTAPRDFVSDKYSV